MTRAELKTKAKSQLGGNIFGSTWMVALLVCLILTAISSVAGSVIPGIGTTIVAGPLTYGASYIFLRLARTGEKIEFGDLFKGFTDDFGQTFLIGFMSALFSLLWSLLLIIPGIIKSYSYSMAAYVKVDHPDYDWKKCLDESTRIMNGHKAELFILDLSFIGWLIVGAFCLGIGALWVSPYIYATHANFYDSIANCNTIE